MSTPSRSPKSQGKHISTFCRVRPGNGGRKLEYTVSRSDEGRSTAAVIDFQKPIDGYVETASAKERRSKKFTFNQVFDAETSQADLFELVGIPVIDNVLNGYNGTIFAYGQTATGKTFTIMGEELEYDDAEERGLIPRALEYIFEYLEASNHTYEVKISFLEIYRENMQDLLGRQQHVHKKQTYETKNKIICKMDDESVRLDGLSYRTVPNSEDAMEVFLEGYQTREVAETYANERSSRSHSVFTLYIDREDDTGKLQSKLHFVDLAGSERVTKDHLRDSTLIAEAKEINRSLLFLHKVIKSISSNKKPETFRNTMITRVLRDSLIGNSMTSLVATISIEVKDIDETLSTCDFAQSVSKIKTRPKKNKTEDLNMIIANLQADNKRLSDRLEELLNPEDPTEEEIEKLRRLVREYYADDDPDSKLKVSEHDGRAQFCFGEIKTLGKDGEGSSSPSKSRELTDEEKRSLDAEINAYIAEKDPKALLNTGNNPLAAQYCMMRLKQILKEFDDRPKKKKGCC